MFSAKDQYYTLIEQSSNSRITCMQYSQKNFIRIIGNDHKNNGQKFWEIQILERIIGKISSIIGARLHLLHEDVCMVTSIILWTVMVLFSHLYFLIYHTVACEVHNALSQINSAKICSRNFLAVPK